MLRLRPLDPQDDAAVRWIFRATLGPGGSPLRFEPPAFDRYADLCLGWYLGPGRDHARVLDGGDGVVGYALVCTDAIAYRRWARGRSLAYVAAAGGEVVRRPGDRRVVRFARLRVRDGWEVRRAPAPMPVHAHMNLAQPARGTVAALLLIEHIDEVCRAVGAPGWYGEVNARAGRRVVGLERIVGPVVHRAPSHTYTWLAGRPVERLTVVRVVEPAGAAPRRSAPLGVGGAGEPGPVEGAATASASEQTDRSP